MVSWNQHDADAHEARVSAGKFERYNAKTKTASDATELNADIAERTLHDNIEAELKRRRWYYVHSRMDKKTTTREGVTDFIIAVPGGKTIWLEVKRHGEKLTKEQNITRHILIANDHWHEVVFSMKQFLEVCVKTKPI